MRIKTLNHIYNYQSTIQEKETLIVIEPYQTKARWTSNENETPRLLPRYRHHVTSAGWQRRCRDSLRNAKIFYCVKS